LRYPRRRVTTIPNPDPAQSPGSIVHSLRSRPVKGAASRLASLGPVGPPLTARPLRLDGNEVR
jgi:hypothetical protein